MATLGRARTDITGKNKPFFPRYIKREKDIMFSNRAKKNCRNRFSKKKFLYTIPRVKVKSFFLLLYIIQLSGRRRHAGDRYMRQKKSVGIDAYNTVGVMNSILISSHISILSKFKILQHYLQYAFKRGYNLYISRINQLFISFKMHFHPINPHIDFYSINIVQIYLIHLLPIGT